MSAHVLLNLFNELGKATKCLLSILSLFRNELNKFNNTRAQMLDSIYHMPSRLLLKSYFWHKKFKYCHSIHNVEVDVISYM